MRLKEVTTIEICPGVMRMRKNNEAEMVVTVGSQWSDELMFQWEVLHSLLWDEPERALIWEWLRVNDS